MKIVLVLGAGLVAGPAVRYLLDQPDIEVRVADQVLDKAQALVGDHARGRALQTDAGDETGLADQVAAADIVISLLPWTLHPRIAALCLKYKKHMVTASYVKEEMAVLDQPARDQGLLFLNEVGVDPGLDHMSAMQIIDRVKGEGGRVDNFFSYCGGLPARESNTNPLGYKFSWSPEGAMLAATNDGRYMEYCRICEVPGHQLFEHYWLKSVPGAGVFEAYVNRDGHTGEGVVVLAVDNLPCELPHDASTFFSKQLAPLVPNILQADYATSLAQSGLCPEVQRAVIVYNGELAEDYAYLKAHI